MSGTPPTAVSRWRAVAIALGAFAVLVGAYAFFAGTAAGRRADAAVLGQDLDGVWEPFAWPLIAAVNPITSAIAALAIAALALAQGRRRAAAFAVIAVVGATASARGLKSALAAVDPFGTEPVRELGPGFYPSGHAAVIMGLCLAALVVLRPDDRERALGTVTLCAAVLLCAVYATRGHHPSDVIGGAALAAAWIFGTLAAIRGAAAGPVGSASRPPPRWSPRRSTARLAAVAAVGVPILAGIQALGLPTGPLQPLLVLSWCVVGGFAIVLTTVLARHLDDGCVAPGRRRLGTASARGGHGVIVGSPTRSTSS